MKAILLSTCLLSLLVVSCVVESELNHSGEVDVPGAADGWLDESRPDLAQFRTEPPPGFSNVSDHSPSSLIDVRYHGRNNFTEAPLPGYGAPAVWLLDDAAAALALVQRDLEEVGLSLLLFDGYRPHRATLAMVAWARRTGQEHLLGEYIAERSSHNHGRAIDLTLARDGVPLDMGTPFDSFDERSHTWGLRPDETEALDNRLTLRRAMERRGFRPYDAEWWHFSYPTTDTSQRDVPYSCYEAQEGEWAAPPGWDQPGYDPPLEWSPTSCGSPFIGSPCGDTSECAGMEEGRCVIGESSEASVGFCATPCWGFCPDRAGHATTFCVNGELLGLDSPSGWCVSRAESTNDECNEVPGTTATVATRFGEDTVAVEVCLP